MGIGGGWERKEGRGTDPKLAVVVVSREDSPDPLQRRGGELLPPCERAGHRKATPHRRWAGGLGE